MSAVAPTISDDHTTRHLLPRGLDPKKTAAAGVYTVTRPDELPEDFRGSRYATVPGLVFPWNSPTGGTVLQYRPDEPRLNDDGDPVKYLFPGGTAMVLNRLRDSGDGPILLAEGTMQSHAAAQYTHDGWNVYGMSGCWSWRRGETQVAIPDLMVAEGRDVVIGLDADAATNRAVYDAGMALKAALEAEGAHSVKFLRLPGQGAKAGLDDVLGSRPAETRATYLSRLLQKADLKPADRAPARKKNAVNPLLSASGGFIDSSAGGLQVVRLADAVIEAAPMLLTRETKLAVYSDGVYRSDGTALNFRVGELLGEQFRTSHVANVESFLIGRLGHEGVVAPDHAAEALLNTANGMLDLATGTLKPWDPSYLSVSQIPVEWNPDATCPVYESWLAACISDQADDLEETVAQMLDPSRTPAKAAFLFGPSRSGKSTFIRLMEAVVGPDNRSSVTLHQLAENRFMTAPLYGKMLNSAADLSSANVEDLSIFKTLTGEDAIQADRKYGGIFSFTNRALFAFSANELPTVGETSRAYIERIKPFRFGNSFAGREDPAIESAMRAELPGILVRWVRAWQRRAERGGYLPTRADVLSEFETRSDRVRQWVEEKLVVEPVDGQTAPKGRCTSRRDLARAFNRWAEENAGSRMGERKILDRLAHIPGVVDVREEGSKARALNLRPRTEHDPVPGAPTKEAEVAVSDHPIQTRGIFQKEEKKGVSAQQGGSKVPLMPPTGDPLRDLIPLLPDVPDPECPDCEQPEELVPPLFFWYACRSCHPGTFTRTEA